MYVTEMAPLLRLTFCWHPHILLVMGCLPLLHVLHHKTIIANMFIGADCLHNLI